MSAQRHKFGIPLLLLLLAAAFATSASAQEPVVPSLTVIGQLNTRAGELAYQKKDWLAAQTLLDNAIRLNPYDGRVAYYLGTSLIIDKDRDPEKLRAGTFYYARAAVLMREPSLVNWVKRQYVSMFRTALGLDHYWDFVRVTPLAPETTDQYPPTPPEPMDSQMAYMMLRDELLLPTGPKFFEDALSMNSSPRFKGRLVSHRPEKNPIELTFAVDQPGKPEIRVILTKAIPGNAPPGTPLEFEGLIRSWQPEPFQLVLQSDPKEIRGWPFPIPVESTQKQ
jgi:hypothetical protein